MKMNENLTFKYTFKFDNRLIKEFEITLDYETLTIIEKSDRKPPEWTEMSRFRCPNCPLSEKDFKYCPLAKHLSVVIEFFQTLPSFHESTVIVETNERTTYKNTTVQIGVGSLMGIIMATSGCPIVGKLKPLTRFHLPFSSLEETEYRVLSMYVLNQYFALKAGVEPDWDLKKLKYTYEEIQKVNKNVVLKLSEVEMNDTSRNAVVTLSNFAEYIIWDIEEKEFMHVHNFLRDFAESEGENPQK